MYITEYVNNKQPGTPVHTDNTNTLINKENKLNLQFLDVIENKDQIAFDAESAGTIINNFIKQTTFRQGCF